MDNLVAKQQLTAQELHLFNSEMNSKSKNATVAWLLWFFLSSVGGHHFYLGKTGQAIGYIALNILGWMTVWFGVGFLFWTAMTVWWIVDAIKMNDEIKHLNSETERKLLERIFSTRA